MAPNKQIVALEQQVKDLGGAGEVRVGKREPVACFLTQPLTDARLVAKPAASL